MHRLAWGEVPAATRAAIEAELGAPVVEVRAVEGGYSPCLAAALTTADGSKVFVKAVSGAQNPESPDFVRREIHAVGHLPATVPAPRLLASLDDGDWVVAIFEHVDGRLPHDPWQDEELTAALAALAQLSAATAPEGLPSAVDRLRPLFDGWRKLIAGDAVPADWTERADTLVALEQRALEVMAGDHLVHCDIRADNLLIAPNGDVVFVDWAHACRGVAWLDVVLWLPALALEGGGPPADVLRRVDASLRPSLDELVPVVAGLAGYFVHGGGLPDPPGLPTLRAFQRAQGEIAVRWLDELLSSG